MIARIKLVGILRSRLGKEEISVEFSEPTKLKDLLKELRYRIPDLREAVEEDGSLTSSYMAFINGVDYRLLGGLDYLLEDNVDISLVPLSHGG